MSKPINNGGYIHPIPMVASISGEQFPVTAYGDFGGMTLRDWFAGQALARMALAKQTSNETAEWAYEIADAMIVAREVKP